MCTVSLIRVQPLSTFININIIYHLQRVRIDIQNSTQCIRLQLFLFSYYSISEWSMHYSFNTWCNKNCKINNNKNVYDYKNQFSRLLYICSVVIAAYGKSGVFFFCLYISIYISQAQVQIYRVVYACRCLFLCHTVNPHHSLSTWCKTHHLYNTHFPHLWPSRNNA